MSMLDGLANYFGETEALVELSGYIDRHAHLFPLDGEEQAHDCFGAYKGYEELLVELLTDFIKASAGDMHLLGFGAMELTPAGLIEALRKERAELRFDEPSQPSQILRALLAVSSFEDYAAESAKRQRILFPAAAKDEVCDATCTTALAAEASESRRPPWAQRQEIFLPWAEGPGIIGMSSIESSSLMLPSKS
eukprot:TRINITY_DN67930_c0_g1_i1.p1 TRINITY_DN67930_c0_g1~~TRINITY_DN67930_c0_g1_i1.p1  ORF type:complete len:193 (-),score=33.38 TRINITY_DN67930_c0_g1_i1:137-715(-)